MKKLMYAAIALLSTNSYAQEPLNLTELFAPETVLEKSVISANEESGSEIYLLSSAEDADLIPELSVADWERDLRADEAAQSALSEYHWRHLTEKNQLETTFIPEFKLGYSKRFENAKAAFYSFGLALVRPSETGMAWNSAGLLNDKRSTFLSFSVYSKF